MANSGQVSKPINKNQIDSYINAIRSRLGKLSALGANAVDTDKAIVTAAGQRLEAVEADLEKLRPRVLLDDGVAQRYQELVLERGRLVKMMGDEA